MNNPSPNSISDSEESTQITTVEIIDRLTQATTDLLWSSESDYPFEVVTWAPGTELNVNGLFAGDLADSNTPIESIDLIDFFSPVITVEDWYERAELAQVDRYTALLQSIESNLTEVQVFRIGEIDITIYVVGKTSSGDIIGIKTHSIET